MAYPFLPTSISNWPEANRVTVRFSSMEEARDNRIECVRWCRENWGAFWTSENTDSTWIYEYESHAFIFHFKYEEDAMLFAARWAA